MPRIHNQLTRGPWSSAIQAALGDSKAEGGIERYGETLTPIVDLWSQPEFAFLRVEHLGACHFTSVAVVAELSFVAVGPNLNDTTSVVVVEAISARTTPPGTVFIANSTRAFMSASQAPTESNVPNRDQRYAGTQIAVTRNVAVSTWVGSDAIVLASGGVLEEMFNPTSNVPVTSFMAPFIVKPGGALVVQCSATNTLLAVNIKLRIRSAFGSEFRE